MNSRCACVGLGSPLGSVLRSTPATLRRLPVFGCTRACVWLHACPCLACDVGITFHSRGHRPQCVPGRKRHSGAGVQPFNVVQPALSIDPLKSVKMWATPSARVIDSSKAV